MSEKRMAGDFEILQAISIGSQEILLGENPHAVEPDTRYMCAYCTSDDLFERFSEVMASDDYIEILQLFCERAMEAADDLAAESKKVAKLDGCSVVQDGYLPVSPDDDLKGVVVVIKPDAFKREYRRAVHQYQFVTGGFGASPNSRGNACHCISLYDGEKGRYERSQVLGIAEELPSWAQERLEQIQADRKRDKGAR